MLFLIIYVNLVKIAMCAGVIFFCTGFMYWSKMGGAPEGQGGLCSLWNILSTAQWLDLPVFVRWIAIVAIVKSLDRKHENPTIVHCHAII